MRKTLAARTFRFLGKPQNPSDFAVETWDRAITLSDQHSRSCSACNKRIHRHDVAKATGTLAAIDPYTPCHTAARLYQTEREAMLAYRALGSLPTRRLA